VPDNLEARIRARAHQIWEEEGRPEGREAEHWEKARILVAIEDDKSSRKPVEQSEPAHPDEPAETMRNRGAFPTAMTDQGDRQRVPRRETAPEVDKAAKRPSRKRRK
jgi:Protein of unknown function (DUF2934)